MKLKWGEKREYERGLDHGVLYLDDAAIPWNGLVSVDEAATGASETTHYYDGVATHITQERASDYSAGVECYTYPDVLDEQSQERFGFTYRSETEDGYDIHLVYLAKFRPLGVTATTTSATATASLLKWDISTIGTPIPGSLPTSHMIINTGAVGWASEYLEAALYGTETTDPYLPSPQELVDIFDVATTLKITHFADGTYTVDGPDELVQIHEDGTFTINAPTVMQLNQGVFTVRSY